MKFKSSNQRKAVMAKLTSWAVTTRAFDRTTGEPLGKQRTEIISKTNVIFKGVKKPLKIKNKYEQFWNSLNPKSKEIVFVTRVKKLK